eukprot:785066-Rhodomonas_salina.1
MSAARARKQSCAHQKKQRSGGQIDYNLVFWSSNPGLQTSCERPPLRSPPPVNATALRVKSSSVLTLPIFSFVCRNLDILQARAPLNTGKMH